MNSWELSDRISKIIEANCENIPYEGTEVNKQQMVIDLVDFIQQLIKK